MSTQELPESQELQELQEPLLQFRRTARHGTAVLEVSGYLEDKDTDAFRDALFQSIAEGAESDVEGVTNDAQGTGDISLDLSAVIFLSGGAIAVLLGVRELQHQRGAKLHLVGASARAQRKLEQMALSPFFPIFPLFSIEP